MPRKPAAPTMAARSYALADGSVTQTWSVRWRDPATGKRVRRSFDTPEEAAFERARVALESSRAAAGTSSTSARVPAGTSRSQVVGVPAGTSVPLQLAPTLGEFWPTWRADAASRLAAATLRSYDGVWKRTLKPQFAAVPMDAIRPRLVSQWRAEMLASGVGPESARRAMVLLQAVFTVAIEWGEVESNPVSVVRKPRQGRDRAVEPLAPEAVEAIRAELLDVGDQRSATLVAVMAYAGLRPGEALGLAGRHVRKETMLIERAVADGTLKRQKTNRAYRTVDLVAPLAENLDAWTRLHPAGPDALLFPRADGQPWLLDDWKNWSNRVFKPAVKRAGLDHARPYDLRHSFASLLIREQKTSIVELAEQLGHAPTMTLNTYSHVFAEHRRSSPVDVDQWIRTARDGAPAALAARRRIESDAQSDT